MILPFSTQMNGQPNYFIEKIWQSLLKTETDYLLMATFQSVHKNRFGDYWDQPTNPVKPKIHTIRKDGHDRWKAGNDIHFYINNRSKNAFQFAPIIKCTGVQTIRIDYTNSLSDTPLIFIDDKQIWKGKDLETLALNDGFETEWCFYDYFNQDFMGKIIHWTNFRY